MRSLLHRALTTVASTRNSRRRSSAKPRFLLACPANSGLCPADVLSGLRARLPGCCLDYCSFEGEEEDEKERATFGACAASYDAVFVVLDKAGQTLPERLLASLRCEKWRYHLLAGGGAPLLVQQVNLTGVPHWRFLDCRQLLAQLGDLMYERAKDVQRIPRGLFVRRRLRS